MKYQHTNAFYNQKYSEYIGKINAAKTKGIIAHDTIKNLGDFKTQWDTVAETTKFPMKDLVDTSLYQSSWEVASAEARALRTAAKEIDLRKAKATMSPKDYAELKAKKKSFQDAARARSIRTMSTQDFAAAYYDEIIEMQHKLEDEGKSKKEIRKEISRYWFGSK